VRVTGIVVAVVIVVLAATAAALLVHTGPKPLWTGGLPWPSEGEAAVAVDGVGGIGTSGTQDPVPIASVTKVMTAYVVLRDHPLGVSDSGPEILVDQEGQDEASAAGESTVPLRAGREFTERQLLELMLVPSGNNVARLLARWDAGSEQAFAVRMNRAAAELGMRRTTYTGASGVENSTTSTATDQLLLLTAVMHNPVFRAIVAKPSTVVRGVPGRFANTNTLLGADGVIGVKTGSSTAAGGALMWAATPPNPRTPGLILGVVLAQGTGGTPNAGLADALATSHTLIVGVRRMLAG
jgi:D-alanyl-D-alanine carboxypeptidase (penicillin-binding protein 5/6)